MGPLSSHPLPMSGEWCVESGEWVCVWGCVVVSGVCVGWWVSGCVGW